MTIDKVISKLKSLFWTLLISITVFLAVSLSVMRIIMPHLASYIPEIEIMLSQKLNADVTVEGMSSGWQGFGPAIRFEEVAIYQPETNLLLARVDHLDVQLDVWESLLQRRFVPGRLTLDGMVLTLVKTEDERLKVQGFDDVLGQQSFNIFDLAKQFRRVDIKTSLLTVDLLEGDPIDLELVYFSLSPRRQDYRLEVDLRRQGFNSKLTIIADLYGEITSPSFLSVDGYMNLEHIDYDPRYMNWAFEGVAVKEGELNLSTWFKWKNGHWQQIIGEAQSNGLVLSNGEKDLNFVFSADIAWEHRKRGRWGLSGDDIILTVDGIRSPVSAFIMDFDNGWDFKLNAIGVEEFLKILELSKKVPANLEDFIEQAQPRGMLKNIQAENWNIGLRVDNWAQEAYQALPGFDNIGGELMLTQNHGQFQLNSEHVTLEVPAAFARLLVLRKAEGLITWQNDEALNIKASDLSLRLDEFTLAANAELLIPEDKAKTMLMLKANTGGFNSDVALRYLPERILQPKLLTWLYNGIERGNVTDVEAIFSGPVMEFPFRENQGEFELRISGTDLDLMYHKDWPMLQGLAGEVVIDTKTVQAYVETGYFYHSTIEQAKLLIKLAPKPEPLYLTISGLGTGPASDIEHFLARSPLWPRMEPTFEQVELIGPIDLDLDLNIPLRAEKKIFNIAGTATMKEGEVLLKKWDLPFQDVSGSLKFSEKMLSASEVQGNLLGRPARLDITPMQQENDYQMKWLLTSTFTPEVLDEYFPSDLWVLLKGESEYSAQFSTYIPKRDEPLQIAIMSDLVGMQIEAPEPLGKPPEKSEEVRFAATFAKDLTLTRFEFGDLIQALIAFQKTQDHYQATRGHIVLGGESPHPFSETEGLEISGKLNSFRLDEWLHFMKDFSSTKEIAYPELGDANVTIDELHYQNYTLNNAKIGLARVENAWNFGIDSTEMMGDIRISDNRGVDPVIFDMQRCTWPALRESTTPLDDPREVMAFDFTCQDMSIGDRKMGYVRLATTPKENGVEFNPIVIADGVGKIEAKGNWLKNDGTSSTNFSGVASTKDLSDTLDNLGINTDIRDAKGKLEFSLNWPDTPLKINKEKLSGEIHGRLTNGRLTEINPGFGRVLGLMSLQGLQRRIRLDFSDVFKEGFSFDSLDGTATIAQGTLYTKDTVLRAPSAKIDISGQAGLVSEALDFNIYVKANVDPTIPAAAVAIANPIAGAAVWVAGKMVNPLGSRAYYHYHVTGTWEEPEFVDLTEEYRKQMYGD